MDLKIDELKNKEGKVIAEILSFLGASQEDILPGKFRNFRGEKRKAPDGRIVNDEGVRSFNLSLNSLPIEAIDSLAALKVRIKELPPKNDEYGDEPLRFVKVNVAYGGKIPPELYLVLNGKKKLLTQGELGLLDGSRYNCVDMTIRTYHRDADTCTLYLQNAYFELEQDPVAAKYASFEVDSYLGNSVTDEREPLPFD